MRRPLTLLIASATALVGLVILAVAFIGIGTRTLQDSQAGDSPCLQAYAADLPGSHIRYTVFPPRSICTFEVDGASTEVVVAAAPTGAAGLGAALALGGAGVCVAVLLAPRLRQARAWLPGASGRGVVDCVSPCPMRAFELTHSAQTHALGVALGCGWCTP